MKPHTNLAAWKLSMALAKKLYSVTALFPQAEKYGVVSQIRRASVSVPSNIAEGTARKGSKETVQFLYISIGSISELETLLMLSNSLGFIDEPTLRDILEELEEISKCTFGLVKKINRDLSLQ
jgi:four helix bundle protein